MPTRLSRAVPSPIYVPLAFLICWDRRESWVRSVDGKSSGEIDAAIVTTHMMLLVTDLALAPIWVMSWDPDKLLMCAPFGGISHPEVQKKS